jgi:ABC-type nitrate/sulfonate/bicarbonate transport system substrate-binding protein
MVRRITARTFLQVTAAVITLASLHGNYDAMAQDPPVRIATAARATPMGLGWIGTEVGIFKQLGLNVAFSAIEAGPKAAQGLIRGDWDFTESAGLPIIQGVLDGHDPVILLSTESPGPGLLFLVARSDITEPGQLAGGRIGITAEAAQPGVVVRAILTKWGIPATLVPLGTYPKIYAALGSREIDAGPLTAEYRLAGQRAFRVNALADLGAEFGFQPAILSTTRRLIKSNRALVARVVEGYVRAIHLFKTDRSVVVPALRRYLQIFDLETTEDIYDYYADRFRRLPLPSSQGIQSGVNQLAPKYPAARSVPVTAFTDTSFLEDLERSGLLMRLYGGEKKK